MSSLLPLVRRHTLSDWVYDFDRFFDSAISDRNTFNLQGDIEETDEHILMSFDFPGMKEGDFSVKVQDGLLIISGERKREEKVDETKKGYKYYGRQYGKFHKQFALPENINASEIAADYENGVLRVALPKVEPEKPKAVEIKVGGKSSLIEKLVGSKK